MDDGGAVILGRPAAADEIVGYETWDSPAAGYIGTNPRNRDGLLWHDQSGRVLAVMWQAPEADRARLAGCDFEMDPLQGAIGDACPADAIVDVMQLDSGLTILVLKRLVALGRPGQRVRFD